MIRRLLLWASTNRFLAERLPRLGFVRRAVRRFIPGETLGDAVAASERLGEEGIAAVLTLLGENVESPEEAREVREHYGEVLTRAEGLRPPAEVSVKLTQLGLDQDPGVARKAVEDLCRRAAPSGRRVWIDMESSPYVERTLELIRAVRASHTNAALCLQAYLYRTEDDLEALLPLEPSIRLVKGAYREPADVAYQDKSEVDRKFEELAEILVGQVAEGNVPQGFATHDEVLVERVKQLGFKAGVPEEEIEFQMLYGIRPGLQRGLAGEGYAMRTLISYGDAWYPWYMRRLAERPANVWFILRNLFRG